MLTRHATTQQRVCRNPKYKSSVPFLITSAISANSLGDSETVLRVCHARSLPPARSAARSRAQPLTPPHSGECVSHTLHRYGDIWNATWVVNTLPVAKALRTSCVMEGAVISQHDISNARRCAGYPNRRSCKK